MLREPELLTCPDSSHNPIEYRVPRLLYEDGGILSVPGEFSNAGSDTHWLQNMMSIWSADWINQSLSQNSKLLVNL